MTMEALKGLRKTTRETFVRIPGPQGRSNTSVFCLVNFTPFFGLMVCTVFRFLEEGMLQLDHEKERKK
jgi:hypothetical protein